MLGTKESPAVNLGMPAQLRRLLTLDDCFPKTIGCASKKTPAKTRSKRIGVLRKRRVLPAI